MKAKFIRRSALTLIEVLISLALTSLLLTFLLSTYAQVIQMKNQTVHLRQEASSLRAVQHRLAQVFYRLNTKDKERKKPIFYTKEADSPLVQGTSLIFSYDNGVVLNPLFSHHLIGRLYLDQENRLCLASWPQPLKQWEGQLPPMKHEVLMEGVLSLNFRFFFPWEMTDLAEGQERSAIAPTWPLELENTPVVLSLLIKVRREKEEKELSLVFPLTHPQVHPVFLED